MSKNNLNDMKLKDFIEKEEFTILDINVSKLSEIVENIQGEVFEHQSRETSQLEQFETKMNTNKLTDVTEKTKNMVADINTFSEFRNKLESKVNIWDQKADVSDLKKIDTSINEDIKKIKVDIEHIVEKNEDFSIQNLNKKFISMDEFRGLEGTVSELSQQVSKMIKTSPVKLILK